MSKFRCIDYWNAGLDELLEFKKVRSILDIYRNGIEVNGEKETGDDDFVQLDADAVLPWDE